VSTYADGVKAFQLLDDANPRRTIRLWSSSNVGTLLPFLQASGALSNEKIDLEELPFNTLRQALGQLPDDDAVVLLVPWDFVPYFDWRSGFPREWNRNDFPETKHRIDEIVQQLEARNAARLIYLQADVLPYSLNAFDSQRLLHYIRERLSELNVTYLSSESFSLRNYLHSGTPIKSQYLFETAQIILNQSLEPAKVLVTDLDNTLWAGVISEDGLDGIRCDSEGKGYKHYIYQEFLRKLKESGVLLIALSKNDADIARQPFEKGVTHLVSDDFVEIVANYHAKSTQIANFAQSLNVGLEAFVFVDDNPIELAEVAARLPNIRCVQFPSKDDGLPKCLSELSEAFSRNTVVTVEDSDRTAMYRIRKAAQVPIDESPSDIREFLLDLKMELTLHDHSVDRGSSSLRARQLINKTNQFNLNGIRRSDEDVFKILDQGGTLLSATLDDRFGSHGEVIVALVDGERCLRSYVMSCRVFQRRLEYAFMSLLISQPSKNIRFDYQLTQRNTPFQMYVESLGFDQVRTSFDLEGKSFVADHLDDVSLFHIEGCGMDVPAV